MKSLGLFLMGEKGFSVLKGIEREKPYFLDLISFVVGAKNTAIENDYYVEIKKFCRREDINFFNRKRVNYLSLEADYAFVISWRWLIHKVPFELIILHDSILPKYRGFNPLVTALIEGDKEIGVTAISVEEDFDSGRIYGQKKITIKYPIKINDAIKVMSKLYTILALKLINDLVSNDLTSHPQDEENVSYSLWRNEEDYKVDWTQKSDRIERFVNAVGYPYKGAHTTYNNTEIRLIDVTSIPDLKIVNRKAGKILRIEKNVPCVVCGRGMLRIDRAITEDRGKEVQFDKLRIRLK